MKLAKTIFATMIIGALTLTGSGGALADSNANNVHQPAEHGGHQHKQLTDEHKQALLDAGVDLKQLKAMHDQIRTQMENIHAHSKDLHQKMEAAKDQKLQQQVKEDLKQYHALMGRLKESKQQYRDLRQELRAAAEAKDSKKIKATFAKLQTNQQDILKLLQAADQELQQELKKLKA
ncbi:hypothetical protein [Tumebacillus lipolyticus]|uniref:Periplasmic heavy metal sensor n=1 Tax=Tumebacillus lipolyticus TaxID=1280370 RepID=A0ABW4ZVA0_9BACL